MAASSGGRSRLALAGVAVSGALAVLAGCGPSPQSQAPVKKPPSQASQQWTRLANGFIEDSLRAQPFFAAQSGRHEFDGQLPDLSAHGLKREISRLHDARTQLAAVDPQPLEPRERFDRDYLISVVDQQLFWLEKARLPFTNPYWYLDRLDPDMYLSRDYAPLEVRMKAFIKYARGIPRMVTDIQANLAGPLPRTYVELAIADFGGLAEFYSKNVGPVFASVADAELQKQLAAADADAATAMNNLKLHFVELRKTANDKFAIGKEAFAGMLKDTEGVDMSVAEVEAAGRADLERNLTALKAACEAYLPKAGLAACVARMSADKPAGGPVEAARLQLVDLRKFIEEKHVVSIPGTEQAKVAEAPIYNRTNSAFIQVPGPYDQGVASVYNIAPPNPQWSKAEQAAYIPGKATLLYTSVHEVWPGHYLQFLHTNANPDKLEALWVGYAFAEGWAHYTEEMMFDAGLGRDEPELHIGQLVDALLRDVRLLSAIGLHTEGMTVAQSEKLFREQAFQDPGNARQQAARGTYDPAYLNYTLGKLMIRKLRADWLAKQGKNPTDLSSWGEFHDTFLSYGGPPIPLLRREMLGDPAPGGLL